MSFYAEKENIVDYKNQKSVDIQPTRTYGKKDQRPPVPIDPPTLTRIYKNTAQRVKLSIESLRSDAVYLLVCDEDKQVIAWFGSESSAEDRELALKIGLEITIKDYANVELEEIPVILEDLERSVQLRYFLDKLWEDEATYRGATARDIRRHRVINSPVTLYIIEKIAGGNYLMKEVKRAIPDELGTVPRIAFASIEKDTIAAVSFGDQWDLWVARGSLLELDRIQAFLSNYITSQSTSGWEGTDGSTHIRVIKQGCERRIFRLPFKLLTNFEPIGKTIPYSVFAQYDISGEGKVRGPPIEESTESSEYDEYGNRYDEYYDEEYDEYGNRYDDYYDENGQPYDNTYDNNDNQQQQQYPDNSNNNNQYTDTNKLDQYNQSFSAGGSIMGSPSIKKKEVQFNDGFPSQNITQTEPNPMAANLPPARIPPPVAFDTYDDIPAPSIISEMKDRKKNPGKYMLSQEALAFRDDENVGPEVRMELLEASLTDAKILIGWQIEIDEGIYAGIRVITGTRKTLFAKTEYRLSRRNFNPRVDPYGAAFDDAWVRLKRLRTKGGLSFRPLRQVLSLGAGQASAIPISESPKSPSKDII